jgi:hypothetical protein
MVFATPVFLSTDLDGRSYNMQLGQRDQESFYGVVLHDVNPDFLIDFMHM